MNGPWADVIAGHSRKNGAYATQKLTFFDRYLPPAFAATKRKITRHYVDLFAGPGVWHDPTGRRHRGSPLKALALSAEHPVGVGFTEVFFVNKDIQDHRALIDRIDMMVDRKLTNLPRDRIHVVHADANDAAPTILRQIHTKSWIFLYADIEKPAQWPWATVEALHSQGHESLDFVPALPSLHMALRRILGYTVTRPEAVTRFYGNENWKEIAARRTTSAHAARFIRDMELLYADGLRSAGWPYVSRQRSIANVGSRTLYYMLFATAHRVAKALSEWESVSGGDERTRAQTEMFS